MSIESLFWVPAVAMLLFTVTYIHMLYFNLYSSFQIIVGGRTKMVSAIFFYLFFVFESHLKFYWPHYPGAGMELSDFASYIGWRLAF